MFLGNLEDDLCFQHDDDDDDDDDDEDDDDDDEDDYYCYYDYDCDDMIVFALHLKFPRTSCILKGADEQHRRLPNWIQTKWLLRGSQS